MRILLIILFFTIAAEAQRPASEAKATAGWTGFIDEELIDHGIVGGSFRYYLTRRLAVEPEVLYMIGPRNDRALTLIPHLSWDFRPDSDVRPYLIGGAGWLRFWDRIGPLRFAANDWSWNFGAGVRIPISPRIFVAPEFRLGIEPVVRAGASIGFTLP